MGARDCVWVSPVSCLCVCPRGRCGGGGWVVCVGLLRRRSLWCRPVRGRGRLLGGGFAREVFFKHGCTKER